MPSQIIIFKRKFFGGIRDSIGLMTNDDLALKVVQHLQANEGTNKVWGIEIEAVRVGYARLSMVIRPDMTNGYGNIHGGMIFALADTAFAYACNSENLKTVGQAASIVYLSPARQGEVLIAEASMTAQAGRSGVASVQIKSQSDNRSIAHFQGQSRSIGGCVLEAPTN